ncbi:MAG: hypothetical protein JNM27_20470 [Leptospirales bacterium]|nr:hypothetical protein [Leptospirales bacterium]
MNANNLFRLILAVVVSTVVYCSKPVPVQELSQARNEIALAEEEQAKEFSSTNFENARQSLLGAHAQLSGEAYDQSKTKAVEAFTNARTARLEAAPKYAQKTKSAAEQGVARAEEAYAEELAKDDYAAAKKLNAEGNEALTQAKAASGDAVLDSYRTAYRKFEASAAASEKARNTALAQKGDLLQSLNGVQSVLDKAERYGAKEYANQEFESAQALLTGARSDFDGSKLKAGAMKMKQAEEQAGLALSKSVSQYAAKKKEEATTAVTGAEKNVEGLPAGKDETKTLRDYAAAAREALNSSVTNYGNQKYEDSIKDSEEAIRLSAIIKEQSLAARDKYNNRDAVVDTSGATNLPAGWQLYTVKKQKPEECLSCISKKKNVYDNLFLWKRIFEANTDIIKNPNLIYPGQQLFVPPKTGKVEKLNRTEVLKNTPAPATETKTETKKTEMDRQPQENMK